MIHYATELALGAALMFLLGCPLGAAAYAVSRTWRKAGRQEPAKTEQAAPETGDSLP